MIKIAAREKVMPIKNRCCLIMKIIAVSFTCGTQNQTDDCTRVKKTLNMIQGNTNLKSCWSILATRIARENIMIM